MSLLLKQLKNISTYVYILIFLFLINIFFTLNYKWDGLFILIRVYLFVFSFYLIYNFSLLDLDSLKKDFQKKYGPHGIHFLFLLIRVIPFLLIHLIAIIFAFINYLDTPSWLQNSILEILNGKNANIIIYSLILLFTLKIRKKPGITIPIFLVISTLYLFILDKFFYTYIPGGYLVSLLKLFKYFTVFTFLLFEFYYQKNSFNFLQIIKLILVSWLTTFAIYATNLGITTSIYTLSSPDSFTKEKSARLILKLGFPFPFKSLEKSVSKSANRENSLNDLIYYAKEYDLKINYKPEVWEEIIASDSLAVSDLAAEYLFQKKIKISYYKYLKFIREKSLKLGEELLQAENLILYGTIFYKDYLNDFQARLKGENEYYTRWSLKVIVKAGLEDSIPFLIDLLSDIDSLLAERAYLALTVLTGLNPLRDNNLPINSPEIIKVFRDYELSR